jgi:hypothetical protein
MPSLLKQNEKQKEKMTIALLSSPSSLQQKKKKKAMAIELMLPSLLKQNQKQKKKKKKAREGAYLQAPALGLASSSRLAPLQAFLSVVMAPTPTIPVLWRWSECKMR